MKNTSGSIIAAGSVVVWKPTATGDEVTVTATAGTNADIIGVAETAINNNALGNIVTRGKVTTLRVDGTIDIAIGDWLTTFSTAGVAKRATAEVTTSLPAC